MSFQTSDSCTYSNTGANYVYQEWTYCYDCFGEIDNKGICMKCATVCHQGHKLGEIKKSTFYCDCPENQKCKFLTSEQKKLVDEKFPNEREQARLKYLKEMEEETKLFQQEMEKKRVINEINQNLKKINCGFNTVAKKIYNQIPASKIFSSFSIGMALGLVHLGARNETDSEITTFFGTKHNIDDLVKLFKHFNNTILRVANIYYINTNLNVHLNQDYFNSTQDLASCKAISFDDPNEITNLINSDIKVITNGLIPKTIESGTITERTSTILVNAVYFKLAWRDKFNKNNTMKDINFLSITDKSTKLVDMMKKTEKLKYYDGNDFHMIEIPYEDNQCVFGVVLSKQDNVSYNKIMENIGDYISELNSRNVILSLPKFTHRCRINLKTILEKCGIKLMFDINQANLSGISNKIYVSDAMHEAVVIVNEDGTEAAAVTAMTFCAKGIVKEKPPVEFNVDHSFMYYIRHASTNIMLFTGEYHGN